MPFRPAARWRFARFGAIMPDMELAEGLILDGHYRLRQRLGRGGMGEVWEAEHTRLPKRFAIKFLLGLSHAEPELLMRFRREAEIASRLSHPSIVQVTDFNTLPDGTAYIAMERLEGEDLRARLARGPLALAEAREITRQVASALELTHREGIVHRDLKPENIFLCREPDGSLRAKVLDFGISKLQGGVGQGTRDDRVLGTPGYMAPEQALGKNSSIDGRTDLFSLATIVYEMLTGESVFVGQTLAELCTKVLYHMPPPLDEVVPNVPRSLALAVSTALAKDPAARQPGIRAFAEAVSTNAEPSQPSSPGTSASDPAREQDSAVTRARGPGPRASTAPRSSLPKVALVAGALMAVAVAFAAWVMVRGESPRKPPPMPRSVSALPAPPGAPVAPVVRPASERPLDHGALEARGSAREQSNESVEPPASTEVARVPRSAARSARASLPPEVEAALAEAERALDRGDMANALRLARNSLREASSERAYFVMARAYCAQHDVGMVQAMSRNLSSAPRARLRELCKTVRVP